MASSFVPSTIADVGLTITAGNGLNYSSGTLSLSAATVTAVTAANGLTLTSGTLALSAATVTAVTASNGLTLTSGTLALTAAGASAAGGVTTGTQTFAGDKTITGTTQFGTSSQNVTILQNNLKMNSSSTTGVEWQGSSSKAGLGSGWLVVWSSTTTAHGSNDTGITRNAAGVMEINSSTAGTYRDLKLRHIIGGSSAPTISVSTGAGTNATASVSGNDMAGTITVNTSALDTPAASATICTITFNAAYGTAPRVTVNPSNDAAYALAAGVVRCVQANASTTTFTLTSGAAPLTALTAATYTFNYEIVG